jgi:hypothetical protein
MKNLLYFLAIILLVMWFIGAFIATVSKLIHLLFVFAIVLIVLRIRQQRKERRDEIKSRESGI